MHLRLPFIGHIALLKTFYGPVKKLWVHVDAKTQDVEMWVPPSRDICNLERESSFFKFIMMLNAQYAT